MATATARTWEIEELRNGRMVKRTVTLAEFRADIDRAKALAKPLMAACALGDIAAAEMAQAAFRVSA